MSFTLALFICIISFLIWVGSLIVLIVVKKNDSAPPEIISLRKRAKGLNIALISVTVFGSFILYFNLLGLAMIVLSVLCIVDSVKLFNVRSQAQQQFGQQNYQQQNYIPQQQTQPVPQEQAQPAPQQQSAKCPNCGGENEAGSYFCVHCGKKI